MRRYGLILILALAFLLLLTCCSGEPTAPAEPEPKPAQDTIFITLEEATWAEPLAEGPCRPPNCTGGR